MKKLFITVALLMCSAFIASAQTKSDKLDTTEPYRRSSLNLIMVEDSRVDQKMSEIMRKAFLATPIPDKYNDHGVDASLRYVKMSDVVVDNYAESSAVIGAKKKGNADKKTKDGATAMGVIGAIAGIEMGPSNPAYSLDRLSIDTIKRWIPHVAYHHIKKHNFAKKAVDKWFGVESGSINIDLIRERAFFNATDQEIKAATESGERDAKDAIMDNGGHEIIGNTFVAISSTRLVNGDQMAAEIIENAAIPANYMPRLAADAAMSIAETAANAAKLAIGKGNAVYTRTYLFRLVWNEEIFDKINAASGDLAKYNALDCFHLEYIGEESHYIHVSAREKENGEKVKLSYEEAVAKAMEEVQRVVLARLEKKYKVFCTKTPLTEVDPVIKANIGTKECVEEKDKYEILQKVVKLDKKSGKQHIIYKSIGTITVDKVGDNLTDPSAQTTFKGKLPKGVVRGTLIRYTK